MLKQQNLMDEYSESQGSGFSAPIINRIQNQSHVVKNLIYQLRAGRKRSLGQNSSTPFPIHNQCQISNIEPVSQKLEKNSFELDLPPESNNFRIVNEPGLPKNRILEKQIGDMGLKYKPRGGVNGRDDIRIKNVSQIHKKIIGNLQSRRNGSHQQEKSKIQNPHFELNESRIQNRDNPQNDDIGRLNSKFRISSPSKKSKSITPSNSKRDLSQEKNKNYLHQINNEIKRNGKQATSDKFLIQPKEIMSYLIGCDNGSFPTSKCPPNKIYYFFIDLAKQFSLEQDFNQPLIKRYKNCIYFGEKVPEYGPYIGFVWYFRKALYYGQFEKGRKNGYGVQIDIQEKGNECIWRGTFQNGKKSGYFELISPKMEYNGSMVNSYFDGEGMLISRGYSSYKGTFQAGMKHGFGVQKFENKKSLVYKGDYCENKFEGRGQLQGPNYFYKGYFKNNQMDGEGFQRTNEFQYEGQFKNGKKFGYGVLKFKNGEVYEGLFENGQLKSQQSRIGNKNLKISKNQYSRKIAIKGVKQIQEEKSFQPSSILFNESRIKEPYPQNEGQGRLNSISRTQRVSKINLTNYTSRIVPLEKHLSKRLNSLYEENENEECTIQQKYATNEKRSIQQKKAIDSIKNKPYNNLTNFQPNTSSGILKLQQIQMSKVKKHNYNLFPPAEEQNQNEIISDGEQDPLEVKVISRQ